METRVSTKNATVWFVVAAVAYIGALIGNILPFFWLSIDGAVSLATVAVLLTVATVAGVVGTRLSSLGRPAPVILTVAFVVAGVIVTAGPVLMLQSLLSEDGFNNIGLGIFSMLGMSLILPMAVLAIVLASVVGARRRRLDGVLQA